MLKVMVSRRCEQLRKRLANRGLCLGYAKLPSANSDISVTIPYKSSSYNPVALSSFHFNPYLFLISLPISSMSLIGPAGVSLNPEQAENFEDVRPTGEVWWLLLTDAIDGEAICCQMCAVPSFTDHLQCAR